MSDNYTAVAIMSTLAVGTMMRIDHKGTRYLLANADGTVYACDEMCTHEDASLYLGALQGDCLKCPLHGSRFDLKTGKPLDEPADEDLKLYPVKVENNTIYVDFG